MICLRKPRKAIEQPTTVSSSELKYYLIEFLQIDWFIVLNLRQLITANCCRILFPCL